MTSPIIPTNTSPVGRSESLANWIGPYVTDMLGKSQAIADQPYSTYQGPLTAGISPLQTQAFQGIGSLTVPQGIGDAANTASGIATSAGNLSYSPTQFGNQYQAVGGTFAQPGFGGYGGQATPGGEGSVMDAFTYPNGPHVMPGPGGGMPGGMPGGGQQSVTPTAQQYMNPYLQQALQPQLDELRRQADISRVQNAGRLTKAGAYGGGRQAIMESEGERNLLSQIGKTTGEGYMTAFDKGREQFNQEQQRRIQEAQLGAQYGSEAQRMGEQSKQFGANYGLQGLQQQLSAAQLQGNLGQMQSDIQSKNLNQLLGAGAQQRAIEQEGITADYNEFLQQRDYPMKQVQFLQSMLQGLPVSAVSNQYQQPSTLQSTLGTASGLIGLYQSLFGGKK